MINDDLVVTMVPSLTTVTEVDSPHAGNCSLELCHKFYNHTGSDITVSLRHGITYDLKTANVHPDKGRIFFVRVSTQTSKRNVKYNQQQISNDGYSNNMAKALLGSTSSEYGDSPWERASCDCIVTLDQIKEAGGSLYLADLDIVVSLPGATQVTEHPYANPFKSPIDEDVSMFIKMDLVDNEGNIGPRYINLTGNPMLVNARKSGVKQSGLYVSDPGNAKPGVGLSKVPPKMEYYSPEQILNPDCVDGYLQFIHVTYQEAISFGSPIEARERQLKLEMSELKTAQQRESMEHDALKRKYAADQEERQRELELQKADFERQKREMEHRYAMATMDRKDYYEDRSYQRKESSEWLKFAPLVISVVGAAIPLLRGGKS